MRTRGRRTAALLLAAALPLVLSSCTAGKQSSGSPAPSPPASESPAPGMDESLRDEALALVEAREQALLDGDREAFLATVDPEAEEFAGLQARWFDNLSRLPLSELVLELGHEGVMGSIAGAGDLQLPVELSLRLRDVDQRAALRRMVYTFVRRGDEVLLADDRNVQIEALSDWTPSPWDVTAIKVRRESGVLGIFDEETITDAEEVMRDLVAARDVVRSHVPGWSGRFVAYDISDLQAMDEMSSMEVTDTAGVAFAVPATGKGSVAGYRFMVNPAHVGDPLSRGIVFRHELVHVALAGSDGRSPIWLREGIAEYVARSVLPLEVRRRAAATQLAGVQPRRLEPTGRFHTRDPRTNYALAAVVCDHLATTRGEDVLWDLVATFRTADYTMYVETESIVRRQLGLPTRDLAAAALAWARAA